MNSFTSFALEDLYNQVASKIKADLSSATMPAMSLNDLLGYYAENQQQTILDSLLNTKLGYSEQYGSLAVRESISNLYQSKAQPSNILLTSGASEAIFLVMSTLFTAGDSIIVQQPIYQSLYQVAADRGVHVIDWNLEENYSWDLNKLAELIKTNPQVKALVINNPNNPTGLGFKREELKRIGSLLDGRYLISDEVFLFISQNQLPSALDVYKNSIVISDLSKSFNMPGLRLGWIAVRHPEERSDVRIQSFSSLKNYLSLRTNTLAETITPWVLAKHQEISSKNRSLIQSHIEDLYSLNVNELIFDLNQIPRNNIEGLCIFPTLRSEHTGFDFQKLLNEQGVFVATGENFAGRYKLHLRLTLTTLKPLFNLHLTPC